MAILVLDPVMEADVRRCHPRLAAEGATEVWEGVAVVPPIATDEHQDVAGGLYMVAYVVIQDPGLGRVRPAINLSDRVQDWTHNYRNPDMAVFLNGTTAVNHDTHWVGGPDFAAEVLSPGERPTAKFGFYESIAAREILLVHRGPWRLELYALRAAKLTLAGTADLAGGVCTSAALGLTFALAPGTPRPRVAVTQPATGRTWSV